MCPYFVEGKCQAVNQIVQVLKGAGVVEPYRRTDVINMIEGNVRRNFHVDGFCGVGGNEGASCARKTVDEFKTEYIEMQKSHERYMRYFLSNTQHIHLGSGW
jgi:hypothetical protein